MHRKPRGAPLDYAYKGVKISTQIIEAGISVGRGTSSQAKYDAKSRRFLNGVYDLSTCFLLGAETYIIEGPKELKEIIIFYNELPEDQK